MPRRGKRRQKTRTHAEEVEADESTRDSKIPRTFVVKKGKVGPAVSQLMHDLRDVMMPYTAKRLRERKGQKLKDFVHIAGPMGISHLMMLTSTSEHTNLRVSRLPRGPTLTFQVPEFALGGQVRGAQKRPVDPSQLLRDSPLVVLNNFGDDKENHVKLASATFQSMFPKINVQTANLATCKRVVLLDYDEASECMEYRHYAIKTSEGAAESRAIKRGSGTSSSSSSSSSSGSSGSSSSGGSGIVGIIGGFWSYTSMAVHDGVASVLRVPMLSYGSFSTQLASKTRYPFFVRVCMSLARQGEALIRLATRFGWSQVGLVYDQDPAAATAGAASTSDAADPSSASAAASASASAAASSTASSSSSEAVSYGTYGARAVREAAAAQGVTIVAEAIYAVGDTKVPDAELKKLQDASVRVVVLLASTHASSMAAIDSLHAKGLLGSGYALLTDAQLDSDGSSTATLSPGKVRG
eukprot:g5366.t1